VVLSEATWVAAVQQIVPHSCRVLIGEARDTSQFLNDEWYRCRVGLVDGSVTSNRVSLLESCGVSRIYFTRRLRRNVPGWHHSNVTVPHNAVGGVTDYRLQLNTLSRNGPLTALPTPGIAPRDVSTVLSIKPGSRQLRSAPKFRHTQDLECRNEGSADLPIFHGGGWLPSGVCKQTRIITPSLFAPKGKWVVRGLVQSELLAIKDVPDSTIRRVDGAAIQLTSRFFEQLVPGKCLIIGYQQFNGGGNSFSNTPKRKDVKVQGKTLGFEPRKDVKVQGTTLGFEPSEQNGVERTSHDSLDAAEPSLHDVTETVGPEAAVGGTAKRGLSTSLNSIHDVTEPSDQNDFERMTHDSLGADPLIHDVTVTLGLEAAVPKRKDGKVHETTRNPSKRKDGRVHRTILCLEPSEQKDDDSSDAAEHETETLGRGVVVGGSAKRGLSPSPEPLEYAPKRKEGKVHRMTLGLDPAEQSDVERQSPESLDADEPSMPDVTEAGGHEDAVGGTAKRGLSPKRDEASRSGKARRTVVLWAPGLEPSEHDDELRSVRKQICGNLRSTWRRRKKPRGFVNGKLRRRRRIRRSCRAAGRENLLRRCRRW
jgi:hypothetical protein